MKKIRVLVVEDSKVFRDLLVKNLSKDPQIEVVASAENPYEARNAIMEYKPDVMTLDIELPRMNGLEFLKKLMPQYPMPVVVISSLSGKVFDAMHAGAVDFVVKPTSSLRLDIAEFINSELPEKIKIAAAAKLGTKGNANREPLVHMPGDPVKNVVVAIGASTGGTEATTEILKDFNTDVPGIIITQHMPAGFTKLYAERLNESCRIRVKEAVSGDYVLPGLALVAPGGNTHMTLVKKGELFQVMIEPGPKVNGHSPSVDVLFESVAKTAGNRAVGIILTGMGADGAKGLKLMHDAGAATIGQDKDSCAVYGMPKAAFDLGAVDYQENPSNVAKKTYELIRQIKN